MYFKLPVRIGMVMRMYLFLFVLVGCSLSMGPERSKSAKGDEYKISFQSPHWTLKKEDRSDYVWINQIDGRIMLSNSFCGEFQEAPLEQLALKTFNSIDNLKIKKKTFTAFNEREAFQTEGEGEVDGVKVSLILLNTRRNNCYFDFVSITPLASAQVNHQDFESLLHSVKFK